MTKLEKTALKRRMKQAHLEICNAPHDCGNELLANISSTYYRKMLVFNKIADKLAKAGDPVPEFRYPVGKYQNVTSKFNSDE